MARTEIATNAQHAKGVAKREYKVEKNSVGKIGTAQCVKSLKTIDVLYYAHVLPQFYTVCLETYPSVTFES